MKKKVECIILSGGGMKGISYIGVFKYIDELKKKNLELEDDIITKFDIKEMCCVSVGSIVGLLYILGYTYEEFYDEIIDKDLTEMKNFKVRNFFTKYGLDNGKNVTDWIIKLIVKKGYSKDMTLRDIWNIFGVEFRIVVSNLNKYKQEIFDYKKNPNLKVVKAIKMAVCIPFIFSVEKYQDTVYVDGALINNFPIKMYDDKLDTLLGINIVTKVETDYEEMNEQIENFNDYLFHVMTCFIVQRQKEITLSHLYKNHTIYVKVDDIAHTIDFSLQREDRQRLIDIGYESAQNYFNKV